jgi:hypothetical protein
MLVVLFATIAGEMRKSVGPQYDFTSGFTESDCLEGAVHVALPLGNSK